MLLCELYDVAILTALAVLRTYSNEKFQASVHTLHSCIDQKYMTD